ncbi:MAG: hypothetical protein KAR42_14695 [candidate division Zixibacteria bacterium]|nr:hypothetical protein [candidate division Zixibacteria bacterium]
MNIDDTILRWVLRGMHERNQIIIDAVCIQQIGHVERWENATSDPLGDIDKPIIIVVDNIDHGGSMIQTAVKNIQEANLALVMFGESLQAVNFPYENMELTSLDHRYHIVEVNEAGLPDQNNKPWYQDRKLNRSKKSRRKI